MDITYEGTDIIVCMYIYIFLICMYYVSLYRGSHASDILLVFMGVSVV